MYSHTAGDPEALRCGAAKYTHHMYAYIHTLQEIQKISGAVQQMTREEAKVCPYSLITNNPNNPNPFPNNPNNSNPNNSVSLSVSLSLFLSLSGCAGG